MKRAAADVGSISVSMHVSDEKPAELLESLIEVHNNRVESYNFAAKHSQSTVLSDLLKRLVQTSLFCRQQLAQELYKLGGRPPEETSCPPVFINAWQSLHRAVLIGDNRQLARECLLSEWFFVAQAIRHALQFEVWLNAAQKNLVKDHLALLGGDRELTARLCAMFSPPETAQQRKAHAQPAAHTTIPLFEPLKTAGRRIVAAFAERGSNFGATIH